MIKRIKLDTPVNTEVLAIHCTERTIVEGQLTELKRMQAGAEDGPPTIDNLLALVKRHTDGALVYFPASLCYVNHVAAAPTGSWGWACAFAIQGARVGSEFARTEMGYRPMFPGTQLGLVRYSAPYGSENADVWSFMRVTENDITAADWRLITLAE